MAIYYLDNELGNDASDGLTTSTAWKTLTTGATAARIAPGDTIRIKKSQDPTIVQTPGGGSVTASFRSLYYRISLDVSPIAEINYCFNAWTAATNVTATAATGGSRCGQYPGANFVCNASFTGAAKVAYAPCKTTNLSSYTKISFNIKTSTTNLVSGRLQIRLCSDATGDTAVHTLTINRPVQNGNWAAITIDNAGALGASIQSVSLWSTGTLASVTIQISDIIATNGLSLSSIVSAGNSISANTWYPISGIYGTDIMIGAPGLLAGIGKYYDDSSTGSMYYREPIVWSTSDGVADSGTLGNPITFSGGWDFSTTTQNGETFIEDINLFNWAISISNFSYVNFERVGGGRNNQLFRLSNAVGCNISVLNAVGCATAIFMQNTITGNVIHMTNSYSTSHVTTTSTASASANYYSGTNWYNGGVNISSPGHRFVIDKYYGGGSAFAVASNCSGQELTVKKFMSVTTAWSISSSTNIILKCEKYYSVGTIISQTNNAGKVKMYGGLIGSSDYQPSSSPTIWPTTGQAFLDIEGMTNLLTPYVQAVLTTFETNVKWAAYNDDPQDTRYWMTSRFPNFYQTSELTHKGFGKSWMGILSSGTYTSTFPYSLQLKKVAVKAGKTYTFNVYVYRTSTSVGATLKYKKGQVYGLTSNVSDSTSGSINTWELLTITLSPTYSGVLQLDLEVYGGPGKIYFDSFSVST